MPDITLGAGEREKVVPDIDTDEKFTVEHLSGGPVHLDHNARDVTNNPARIMTRGDAGRLERFRNSQVYAYVPEGAEAATLRVSRAGFLLNLFSNKTVERPQDEATRNDEWDTNRTGQTVTAGTTQGFNVAQNVDGTPRVFEQLTIAQDSVATTDSTDNVFYVAQLNDGNGNILFETVANGPDATFDVPGVKWPPGGYVIVETENYSASDVSVAAAVAWRSNT